VKKVIAGIIIGVVFLVLFIAFGGSRYLKKLGRETEEAAERLGSYEKKAKEAAKKAEERIEKIRGMAEEAADKKEESP